MSRPHAVAALLRWGNLYRRSRRRILLILLLGSMAAGMERALAAACAGSA